MDNYLESDEIIYQRIKYNNFRKYKTTYKNLNQIRKDNRKIRLYYSKFKNKNLDISLFHNDREDSFIKYKNNTKFPNQFKKQSLTDSVSLLIEPTTEFIKDKNIHLRNNWKTIALLKEINKEALNYAATDAWVTFLLGKQIFNK